MFRPMRRARQELSLEECEAVLDKVTSGVLALDGDEGYPYAVPLSFVYDGKKIFFHSARKGHKIDSLKRNPKASFCVIEQDEIHPDEYTTYFRSVIVFGKLRVLETDEEIRRAAEKLGLRYAPDVADENLQNEIDRFWNAMLMIELQPEHISGKEARELRS